MPARRLAMKKNRLVVAALVGWLFADVLVATPQFVQGLHLAFPGSGNWAAMSNALGIRIGDQ